MEDLALKAEQSHLNSTSNRDVCFWDELSFNDLAQSVHQKTEGLVS
jgi:hypothetical protein